MTDHSIDTLLSLHGSVIDQEDGYWVKLEAWTGMATADIPHGVRYSLTLHAPSGKRLLGFDNAHAVKVKGKKFAGQRLPFDHKHRTSSDHGVPYSFSSAHQLLSDFFKAVDSVLQEVKAK
jgi:hypothetical protein